MPALDDRCREVFLETYGEEFSTGWRDEWFKEFSRVAPMEKATRSLCREFTQLQEQNLVLARRHLLACGLELESWNGSTDSSVFMSLSPMTREFALKAKAARRGGGGLQSGIVEATKDWRDAVGRPLLNVAKPMQFVIWTFEVAICDGPGFPYLDPETPCPCSTSTSAVPLRLRTFESLYLSARELAAIGRLLFPGDFSAPYVKTTTPFDDLRRKMKQALRRYGENSVSMAAAEGDNRTERDGRRRQAWERWHPAGALSMERRERLRDAAEVNGRSMLPAWLPWPDGFRSSLRSRAAEEPEVRFSGMFSGCVT